MAQSEVGRQGGLSRSAVTQIESRNRDVTAEEVVQFSTFVRHSPEALVPDFGQGRAMRRFTDSARDRLIDMANTGESDHVLSSGRLPHNAPERVAFVSRPLVLATEARRRGALSADRLEQITGLSDPDDKERVRLPVTGVSETAAGRNPPRRQLA